MRPSTLTLSDTSGWEAFRARCPAQAAAADYANWGDTMSEEGRATLAGLNRLADEEHERIGFGQSSARMEAA